MLEHEPWLDLGLKPVAPTFVTFLGGGVVGEGSNGERM